MKIDVKHIAHLANLELTDDEVPKFEKQLSEVLGMVEKLNELDTHMVEETSQVTGLKNVTREDTSLPSFSQEEALSDAPAQHNGLFAVKGIFEEEE